MLPDALQPYAKAAYPFLLSLVAVLVQWVVTGAYDQAEAATQLTGLLGALLTLLVPNDAGGVKIHPGEPIDTGPPEDLPKKVGRKIKGREFTTLGTDVQTEYEGPPERKPTKKSR